MDRRQFVWAAGALATLPMLVGFQRMTTPASNAAENFQPWQPVSVPEDARRVYQFFSFGCSYCRQTHSAMTAWGNALPGRFRFEQVPILASEGDAMAASVYYATADVDPGRLPQLAEAIYYLLQDEGRYAGDPTVYAKAASLAGLNRTALKRQVESPGVIKRVERAHALQRAYGVTMTPTVAIAGKYVTHAGFTNGSYEVLMKLMSGLVSREMGFGA